MKFLLILLLCSGDDDEKKRRTAGVRLSLRQSIHLALNHNLDIEIARYQPWIEDQNVLAALGTFDWVAYASGEIGETTSTTGSVLSGADLLDQDAATFTVGVRRVLPFGASFDASFTSSRSLTNSSFALFNPQWNQKAGVSVTLPLLRGAGLPSNYSSVLIARNNRQISVYTFERTLTESVFSVHQAYWDLVFAIENHKVKQQSLAVARKLRDENVKKYERGVLAKVDVTQAEAGVANQEEGILTAEAQVHNAMDRLKRLVDPRLLRTEGDVWPSDVPRGYDHETDVRAAEEQAMKDALAHRPDYVQLVHEENSLDLTIERYERETLPRFDLTGRAYFNGLDDSFSESNRDAYDFDTRELTVGFIFEWPLGTSAARGTLQRTQLEKRRLWLRRANLENQILVEVREAVRRIKTDEKRIQATRKARILAQEQFEAELKRREMGLTTTFGVLDVQEDLTLAQTNEIKAMIDYRLSLANLDRVAGTLLARSDIRLQDHLAPRIPLAQK